MKSCHQLPAIRRPDARGPWGERATGRQLATGRSATVHLLPLLLAALLAFMAGGAAPAAAQGTNTPLTLTISQASATMVAGDWINFSTILTNQSGQVTGPLAVHLSVTTLKEGPHVDPEDWSPQRTQFVPTLAPGESLQLNWRLHALFAGEFATYITAVPVAPGAPVAMSSPLLLDVTPDQILPLGQVIPVAALVPLFPLALLVFSVAYSRKKPRKNLML